ncbi:outer membrane protein assembly factor BamE [Alloalcanivorax gelatiniphagus]|uniref:Outer membrane protein assembly factor BamE n=1 Tax=Alloalcanivorax gelatiniphagus TaxID=1194167 RepID=A0ABY2XL90_9GAMM|nr:outer membrane protein assembly factor BamE [Alloalcanivorax gelatiniphagus]TMW12985.1 outer membrane protein assembly factor BamE [Alloalcanivorax gelatiniphagus]
MKTALAALLCVPLLLPFNAIAADGPTRGMSKAQVRQQYGEPDSRQAPVGQPPISRWHYPGFTVYFENDTVLHSVDEKDAGKKEAAEKAAADGQPGTTAVERQAGHPLPPDVEDEEAQIETRSEIRNEDADSDDQSAPRGGRGDDDTDESHKSPGSTAVRARADEKEERREGEQRPEQPVENSEPSDEKAGRFRFDPVSGRIVIDNDEKQEERREPQRDGADEPRAKAD